jgi:hypothetical protein
VRAGRSRRGARASALGVYALQSPARATCGERAALSVRSPRSRSVVCVFGYNLRPRRGAHMSTERERAPRVPPRWFIRAAWVVHRGMYRASGGRFGLRRSRSDRWGMLALNTIGRRTGRTRRVIDGLPRGWAEPHHDGDERVGRRRTRVVVEPAGIARNPGRARRQRWVLLPGAATAVGTLLRQHLPCGSSIQRNSPLSRLRMAVFPDPGEPVRMMRFAPEL